MIGEKFSIIIPVHNVEKYIGESIESILNQDYENWELILVENASTDNSYSICESYEEMDSRIKVFQIEVGSVSKARNAGLDNFNGDKVIFVDGDDKLADNALSELSRYDYDIVNYSWQVLQNNKLSKVKMEVFPNEFIPEDFKVIYEKLVSINDLGSVWSKCSKADFFNGKKSKIRFDENLFYMEDQLFCCHLFEEADNTIFITNPYYIYRIHNENTVRTYNDNMINNIMYVCNEIYKLAFTWGLESDFIENNINKRVSEQIIAEIDFLFNVYRIDAGVKKKYFNKLIELYDSNGFFQKKREVNIHPLNLLVLKTKNYYIVQYFYKLLRMYFCLKDKIKNNDRIKRYVFKQTCAIL